MSLSTPHLNGLSEMADRFDVFFLDIFGLLHNGITLYSGTINCLEELLKHNKKICLVSNTPRLPENVMGDLRAKGLESHLYHEVVTAGYSARHELIEHHRGKKIFYTGKDEFIGFIQDLDLVRVEDPADADIIINAISGLTPQNDKLIYEQFGRALEFKKPMLCANPDMVVHIGDTLYTCAGTYAKWYADRGEIGRAHV